MKLKAQEFFNAVKTEGGILPLDILKRIVEFDNELEGLKPKDYHLVESEKINEEINFAWNKLLGIWASFKKSKEKVPENSYGNSVTIEKWLLPLFDKLGYGRLQKSEEIFLINKLYPISYMWQGFPIHLVSFKINIDKRVKDKSGTLKQSPFSLLQEFLNRSEEHLWGFLSNGLKLRILRDNKCLTRQSYVEFDIEAIMEGQFYSDFVLMWLLCHQSRVEDGKNCYFERWMQVSKEQGTRALDQLRKGVKKSIEELASGFLKCNRDLRKKLKFADLSKQDFYKDILRTVYRFLFLLISESRDLLLTPNIDDETKNAYYNYYSITRIKKIAEETKGTKHIDLWIALSLIFDKLRENGCPELGITPLNSFLWSKEATININNCKIENTYILNAIRALMFITEKNVKRYVDYKNLGAEEIGSVYESLLEYEPQINCDIGDFELLSTSGNERKSTGSYYTPTSLINCLLDSAVEPMLDKAIKEKNPEEAILNLKICDPSSGSGHFLIAAAHRVAKRLAMIRTEDSEPEPESIRTALRDVIGKCIYGVDLNPMAVELCKFNLWIESLEPGKPLSFIDHHIKCGDSAIGATPKLLKEGIRDKAFTALKGDDKVICAGYKKQNKEEIKHQTRFDFYVHDENNLPKLGNLAESLIEVNKIKDDTILGIKSKQEKYSKIINSLPYKYIKLFPDAWCASFVWKKTKDSINAITNQMFFEIEKSPHSIPESIQSEIEKYAKEYNFFHWHIEFPDVFSMPQKNETPENEETGWNGGFDILLGNPPWERIKLQEKEWFQSRDEQIANAQNKAAREKMIEKLKTIDPFLYEEFFKAQRKAEGISSLLRNSNLYPLCGCGDINIYAIFAEKNRTLMNKNGYFGCIVPTGIATDDTTKFFFQDLVYKKNLVNFYDFENRKGIFSEVHRSYKFCLLTLSKGKILDEMDFSFFALSTEDLKDEDKHFYLTSEDIKLLNPNTKTCPIFRSKKDAEITKAIYKKIPVLINEDKKENLWDVKFFSMFHMSNNSNLFKTKDDLEKLSYKLNGNIFEKDNEKYLPLYEAKMAHHFDHRWATYIEIDKCKELKLEEKQNPNISVMPRYWVSEENVNLKIKDKNIKWFLGFRNVTNNTNERTAIFSIIPKVAVGNSFPIILIDKKYLNYFKYIACSLNTFVSDFVTRQNIGGINLNFFIVKQLPVLPPDTFSKQCPWSKNETIGDWLKPRVLELTYTAYDLKEFAKDCGYEGEPFKWDVERRFLLRCELDAAFFILYGVEKEDVDYIMETFPIVKKHDLAQYNEYRTKNTILKFYDKFKNEIE